MPRKRLRIPQYDYSTPGVYYVTICVRHRRRLLTAAVESLIADHINALTNRFPGVEVVDYRVMADHVHIVLFLPGGTAPLPAIVQAFKSLTTLAVPECVRPLWQRNYYEHIIRDDEELISVREYLRDNPLAEEIKLLERGRRAKGTRA